MTTKKDIIPKIATEAIKRSEFPTPTHIIVNGYLLTVEEYTKNYELHNNKPIKRSYLKEVLPTLALLKESTT